MPTATRAPAPIAPNPAVAVPTAAVAAALDQPIGGATLLPRHVAAPVHHAPSASVALGAATYKRAAACDGTTGDGDQGHARTVPHTARSASRALVVMRIRRRLRWPPLLLLR